MSITVNTNKKIQEYNITRLISILLVVLGHSDMLNSNHFDVRNAVYTHSYTTIQQTLRSWIYSFHMPLFMILSGALFYLTITKYTGFKSYLISRFKRLVLPFIFVGIFVSVPIRYIVGYYGNDSFFIALLKSEIVLITPGALWFLIVLFFINITFYILRNIIIRGESKWILIISCITFGAYLLHANLPVYFQLYRLAEYLIYFWIGIFFEKLQIRKYIFTMCKKKQIIIMYICLFSNIILLYFNNILKKSITSTLIIELFIALLGTAFVFTMCCIIKNTKLCNNKLWSYMSKYNFEIYLYHEPYNFLLLWILYIFGGLEIFNSNIGYILLLIFRFIMLVILSVITGAFIKKVSSKGES